MDIGTTVSAVRKEYKDYLREKHPDWAENTVKTHVSDAFYIWNNTLLPSFWKTLIDDESMEIGRQAIYNYLKNDLLSDTAEVRAKAYFADLSMLKEFLDTVHGGVIKRVGAEIDCESLVYKYAKMAYDGDITTDQAVEYMVKEVPAFGETSHKLMVMLFAAMMKGDKYTRRANTETTLYFINQMGADYGIEYMTNALKATQDNIKYYYEQTGNKSNSICRGCKKIAADNGIEIAFDDSIFEGIIPKKNTTDDDAKIKNLHKMVALSKDLKEELLKGNINAMGEILHTGWMYKKELANGISNPDIDYYYDLAMKNGATGGKLLGAGGGGFLLFYVEDEHKEKVRKALSNLKEINFGFDNKGTNIVHYNKIALYKN